MDATGVGEPVSSFLRQALGRRVLPFTFSQKSKSELGFNLIAAVNAGRLKVYKGDGSAEYGEFWGEMERAKSQYRPNRTMNFYVDRTAGARRLFNEPGADGKGGEAVCAEGGEGERIKKCQF